jgi:ribosomal-protein-alanine N-acetyltransferase
MLFHDQQKVISKNACGSVRVSQECRSLRREAWNMHSRDVMHFFDYGPHGRLEETVDPVRRYRTHYERHGFGKCIIVEKGTNAAIGDTGLSVVEDTGETQVGYKLAQAHWGHGFATEVATALVEFGFTRPALPRIVAFIHPGNLPSIRVIQKVGLRYCRKDSRRGMEQLVYEMYRREAVQVSQDECGT